MSNTLTDKEMAELNMDVKLTMVLTDRGRERTYLGWEQLDIVDFGYASNGTLETVLCVGEYTSKDGPTGTYGIFTIGGYMDIFEDLFANYDVKTEAPSMPECSSCKLRHPLDQSCPVGFTTDF
jgi:hypothetical protein